MPESEVRSLQSMRKTTVNDYLIKMAFASTFSNISNDCKTLSSQEEIEQFLSQEDQDDLGDGVIHTRTKKMFVIFSSLLRRFERFSLKRHPRKPTDIIVATDGLCFSACCMFADNCIASGSAIVTGYGVSAPGDEKFVAAQCPSIVFDVDNMLQDNEDYGISARTTLTESYLISQSMTEIIPLDYSIMRVDKHCGYNVSLEPNITELLKHTRAVYEEFKTKCNPDNERLLLVNDKCHADDPNALYSGYVCGQNGEWNKKQCKIAACKPGYAVDFETNSCVPNCCDPRVPNHPSSSSVPQPHSSSSSKSLAAASNLHPTATTISAFFIIMMNLAFKL